MKTSDKKIIEKGEKNLLAFMMENAMASETLEREITSFGNSAHISLPRKYLGKTARVSILQKNSFEKAIETLNKKSEEKN